MIMPALSATKLLAAWEQGYSQPPFQRALTLLTLVSENASIEQLAALSVGQRDAHLLMLRERAFGPRMTGHATCPACAQTLELDFSVADIRANDAAQSTSPGTLIHADYEVRFRLPNSFDLASLTPDEDVSANRAQLIRQCVFGVQRNGMEIPVEQLPAEVVDAMSQQMADADPQADVQLAMTCPQCDHRWNAPLDILSFLWTEIQVWAKRLMREIHALAMVYGWREADILALSPWRRQVYLEMIHQ
ncbi:MAG: hypothetical protein ABL888_02725 [Pirellulaceae bacterium]